MNDVISAIASVGFPIVACGAIAYVGYKYMLKIQAAAEKREETLLRIIDEQGESLRQIAVTLEGISERIDKVEDKVAAKLAKKE